MDIGGGRVDGWEALASKYRKIRILGSGLNGSVYLAEHKTLGVYRAIKIVPKLNNHLFEEFRKEAQILKNLHHPGIPIIYDLEESKEAMYLVEEYMQGENLYSRVHEIGVMPYQELVTFALALCGPMDYLHKQSIFHLDIQPGNLIIKDGQVSIIDFDHSQKQDNNIAYADGYGTRGYAAPEQYTGGALDARTDIYSMAAIVYYAGIGRYPSNDQDKMPESWGKLREILRICLSTEKNERYASVEQLKNELLALECKNPSQRIAFISSAQGVGTTWIALGFVAFLLHKKRSAIYEERNSSLHMTTLQEKLEIRTDGCGYFRYKNIPIRPWYRENVELERHSAQFVIEDYGVDVDRAIYELPDVLICVCRHCIWHMEEALLAMKKLAKKKYILICNLGGEKMEMEEKNCLYFPFDENIFLEGGEKERVYERILQLLEKE